LVYSKKHPNERVFITEVRYQFVCQEKVKIEWGAIKNISRFARMWLSSLEWIRVKRYYQDGERIEILVYWLAYPIADKWL
jgi:hypothetical protein